MKLKYFISVGLLIALPRVSMAQVQSSEEEILPRSTYTAVTVGMGGMYNQDQYLSPLPYGGNLILFLRTPKFLWEEYPPRGC